MYSSYQDREEIEDDLYREEEGDSEGSEVNSEVEFRLYSQLHYSSNAVEDEEEKEHEEKSQDSWPLEVTANDDAEIGQSTESRTLSHKPREQQKPLKAGTKQKTGKGDEFKGKGASKGKRPSSSVFEEVIVIDSDPDVITLSEDDTAEDDDGVCAVKGRQLRTSTPAQKVGILFASDVQCPHFYIRVRGAMVQVAHSTVRTSVFGPLFWFGFGTCFVRKENCFFFSPKITFLFCLPENFCNGAPFFY
uniref:Uncharacterized protein n=1 Tax=Sphaeramia orbicularis TaxID=375764 RepID=A0A673CBU5_9TELE